MGAPAHLAADQPGAFEHLDVLGGCRERDGEWLRELADRPFSAGKFAQHPPACAVAKGVKDGREFGRL